MLGVTTGRDGGDEHRSIEVARGDEAGIGDRGVDRFHAQPDAAEKIIPRDFVGARNVAREEGREVRVGDGVASVTSVALQDKADPVDALADKVATDVRSTEILLH